jgi:hypothetical protein
MNKQTKMILGVAAVGVAGYFVFKSMKPKTQNFGGDLPRTRIKLPRIQKCGEGCDFGRCFVPVVGATGQVTNNLIYACTGTTSDKISTLISSTN